MVLFRIELKKKWSWTNFWTNVGSPNRMCSSKN